MNYELPTTVEVNGVPRDIRSDFRAALDICVALNDTSISDEERGYTVLSIFYPDLEMIPQEDWQEAVKKLFWFIRGGEEEQQTKGPTLVSWDQDFQIICPAVNRIMGHDIRADKDLHWWTFLAAYMEIGECMFSQVVSIRSKMASGKKLDKTDKEFYRKNRNIIDIKKPLTDAEMDIIKEWT